jgi:holo-[acyl-carrier protein] synthase|tara:strand:- start:1219 stop:1614 length:396 start_codon:yes stop_codon:yes gene_type:complete
MQILGTGVDIVENTRIKTSLRNKLFVDRIFTSNEIALSKKVKNKTNFYSKRFAAKEAFAKSIGTGFSNGLNFKDISVINNKAGKPSFVITNKIKKIIKDNFKVSSFSFFLSISDEKNYSIAFVILQKNNAR